MLYIGLDDTDTRESRGTGNLARTIASLLSHEFTIHGVVRHQLLKDPGVPCTSHNSSAAIVIDYDKKSIPDGLFDSVKNIMLSNFQRGSDPGLCILCDVPPEVQEFGRKTKKSLVDQSSACSLANKLSIKLEGLGGTNDGIIGALAAVGLSASGDDGRYVLYGSIRELAGLQKISDVIGAGVSQVKTLDGKPVTDGLVMTDKLRPARRSGRPVAYVEWQDTYWKPLTLD